MAVDELAENNATNAVTCKIPWAYEILCIYQPMF